MTDSQTHARRLRKFAKQNGRCHWCKQEMTIKRGSSRGIPDRYATFEHLQRRRDGGAGKPNNVVLACYACNNKREVGQPGHYTPPKAENLSAWRASKDELRAKLATGTYTPQELGEIYSRGLVPNWPMWSKLMAATPLCNP